MVQQAGEIITRVGPSERLPGLKGVFLTRAVKKFSPIEVLAGAASATTSLTTPAPLTQADASMCGGGASVASSSLDAGEGVTIAPPLVLNLAFAARHHVSLRRFLALRHMFSSTAYFHVATEQGWYLVAPSTAAPLCADVEGLQRWVGRHHKRYVQREEKARRREGRRRGATEEGEMDDGTELTEEQLRALAAEETQRQRAANRTGHDDEEEGEEDLEDGEDRAEGGTNAALPFRTSTSTISTGEMRQQQEQQQQQQLRRLPPLITESHLFEINDGVAWELPPPDDLANLSYWKNHRQRMTLYESTGDADAAEQREAVLAALRSDPRSGSCTEQELHAAAEMLFQTLKQKANVALRVEDATGLLTLVPLLDLPAGTELCLHYGREWWTGRLLSALLLAVPDAEMAHIRWIEQLFGHLTDHNELFPMLVPAHQRRKHKAANSRHEKHHLRDDAIKPTDVQDSAEKKAEGSLVLYNTVTRSRATDAAVLAFAVRRSCLDADFFHRLVVGDAARGLLPLFHLSSPDAPVPMRALRRALLTSLRGDEGEVESEEKQHGRTGLSMGQGVVAAEDEEDGGVFSV